MKNRDEINFEEWKKQRLTEGFLDGEEEKPATSDEEAPAAEAEKAEPEAPEAE